MALRMSGYAPGQLTFGPGHPGQEPRNPPKIKTARPGT